MVASYVPDVGDIVWLAGRRPALVLTPRDYNARAQVMICCPITNAAKGYPFEVPVESSSVSTGVILVDQIRSIDWLRGKAEYQGRVGGSTLKNVRTLLTILLAIH